MLSQQGMFREFIIDLLCYRDIGKQHELFNQGVGFSVNRKYCIQKMKCQGQSTQIQLILFYRPKQNLPQVNFQKKHHIVPGKRDAFYRMILFQITLNNFYKHQLNSLHVGVDHAKDFQKVSKDRSSPTIQFSCTKAQLFVYRAKSLYTRGHVWSSHSDSLLMPLLYVTHIICET